VRDTFVSTLMELASADPRLMLLTGDLGFGVLTRFAAQYPRQFLNVGVAEQNLTGIATGLALSGHTVFTYSIANFPTLRCLEQIRNDACYHAANVKVVAIGAGFSYGALGISHHATEDLSIMRALPAMTVFSPADRAEAAFLTRAAYQTSGTCYLRLDKSAARGSEVPIVAGRVRVHKTGRNAVILASGGILEEALAASDLLRSDGIDCGVVGVHTVKPPDREGIAAVCRSAPVVITLEEHTIDGGLGSLVAEICMDTGVFPAAFRRIGLRSEFSSIVGSQAYLRGRYGLDGDAVCRTVKNALAALTEGGPR
jgi:transketolase